MTFQQTTPCKIRLKKKKRQTKEGKKKRKKEKKVAPRPSTKDSGWNCSPVWVLFVPQTHKHPNVTLSLGIPFEFNVIMNVKSLGEVGGGWGRHGGVCVCGGRAL